MNSHKERTLELKKILAHADISKAGDRNAKLASSDLVENEKNREVLSNLTLQYLYDHPLTNSRDEVDEVMQVNYEINENIFNTYASCTVGEFKDFLLKGTDAEVSAVGKGLTGVMAAAVAKLCDVHELIYIAKKINRPTRARTQLGLRNCLSSRLQPNHPTDDLRGITLLTYLGLSLGSGDALIGMNPAVDTIENISKILNHLKSLREKTEVPTQICVLSHIKTQIACLKQGAPVEIMFQSLAGTQSTNETEFDLTVDTLNRGYDLMKEKGPLKDTAEQFMYFETGQGSEFTYSKHEGIDMTTLEALCYGLARKYDPFMVNNVTGFIGPETHLDNFEMIYSCLQDHFMGKLLGLPMGMAPCFTLHANIALEGQQMATQMLTAAGANFYMDVYLNTDRMLAYFDTSAHDNQTLREIYNKQPSPEYLEWALKKGIFKKENNQILKGENFGKLSIFASSSEIEKLTSATPALYGFENSGPRPQNKVTRKVRINQAIARDAVFSELNLDLLKSKFDFIEIKTEAHSKEMHLNSPILGSLLSAESKIKDTQAQIQLIVTDGLSAEAVHQNIPTLVPLLTNLLSMGKYTYGLPLVAKYGRVKLAESVLTQVTSPLVVILIGERPGGDAEASKSLSAYFLYASKNGPEYSVISNIYKEGGVPPEEAAALVYEKIVHILGYQANGNRLEEILKHERNL